MKIISNTGPIIGLAKIDLLFLLRRVASEILIPPMVHRELLGKTGNESDRIDKALKEFLSVKELSPLDPVTEMAISGLDEGEKQVIGLASTMRENVLVLIDDRAGREVAKRLNISFSGVVGLLLLGKERGLIEKIGPTLDELPVQGYWLSDKVLEAAKRLAGEM
jgi:predicted nucleic acid-binding protein